MLQPNQTIANYRIVRFLGAGGMGSVYEVEHTAMGTRHAIKVLGDQYVHSDNVRQRFKREAQLMFQLGGHPNIVRATDLIDTPEVMALVVDLVTGGDLAQAIESQSRPLPWKDAWAILHPIVAAVAYAHERNVVHRDLKPENVLLQPHVSWPGTPLVADFGIAKVLGSDSATRTQARMGTACYGSPEQFKNAKDVGPEADVWALGMLVYRLVAGRLPVDPDNQSELYELYHGHRTAPRLTGVPAQVADAVAAALSVDPQRRPRDAGVLEKLLAAGEVAPPVQATAATPAVAVQAGNSNKVAILVGFAMVAAAVVYVGTRSQPAPGPTEIVRTTEGPATPEPAAAEPAAPAPRVPEAAAAPPPGMVYLAAGTFEMGSESGESDERPVHKVTLTKGFFLDKTEVTVAAYAACVRAERCAEPDKGATCNWGVAGRDNHPVNCVDWNQARKYCAWQEKQLPSEAQWEYAARSGGKPGHRYPWGDEEASCARAVMDDGGNGCGKDGTWPVCSKAAGNSAQGVCDLAGNVLEWVADAYDATAYARADGTGASVENNDGNANRVLRGGSWYDFANLLRAASRNNSAPDGRSYDVVGFRCSRTL